MSYLITLNQTSHNSHLCYCYIWLLKSIACMLCVFYGLKCGPKKPCGDSGSALSLLSSLHHKRPHRGGLQPDLFLYFRNILQVSLVISIVVG